MKPSNLVEKGWATMGYSRMSNCNSEVLAAVYGPFESRNSQKSDYSKCLIEVVISDMHSSREFEQTEKVLSEFFASVVDVEKYPYMTIVVNYQIFSKDMTIVSTLINAGYSAIIQANLELKCRIVAKDFVNDELKLTLAIVPFSDFILLSLCEGAMDFEYYQQCVKSLENEKQIII